VRDVLDALAVLMSRVHAGRVRIAVDADAALVFAGSREDLEEMLGNLLDNACKWATTQVSTHAWQRDGALEIRVEDDGPGIDDAHAATATQRGVRLDERTAGSGLGLSIVEGVAAGYGGVLALERSELGGLAATLSFRAGGG
jgi:signal transduction histidine kinase